MLNICPTYLTSIFFAITATSPVNTPTRETIVVKIIPATGGGFSSNNVDLHTFSDPNSPVCNSKVGRPGGVYICPGPNFTPSATQKCRWWPPPAAADETVCISYKKELGLDLSRPQSIGPDPDGYCLLYQEPDCRNGAQAHIITNGQTYNTIGCPGLNGDFGIADKPATEIRRKTTRDVALRHPALRPKLPKSVHQNSSRLDVSQGPLRATSDCVLVKEQTGDYVNLDLPPRTQDSREPASTMDGATTKAPIIELQKASNGGNGLDDPRRRKPVWQLFEDVRTKLR